MAETLKERLEKQRNRTAEELRRLESEEQGGSKKKKKKKKKKAVAEKRGTGETSFDLEGAVSRLREQMEATSDPAKKENLKNRIKLLRENQ